MGEQIWWYENEEPEEIDNKASARTDTETQKTGEVREIAEDTDAQGVTNTNFQNTG